MKMLVARKQGPGWTGSFSLPVLVGHKTMLQFRPPKHLGFNGRDPEMVRDVASPCRGKGGAVSQRSGL